MCESISDSIPSMKNSWTESCTAQTGKTPTQTPDQEDGHSEVTLLKDEVMIKTYRQVVPGNGNKDRFRESD